MNRRFITAILLVSAQIMSLPVWASEESARSAPGAAAMLSQVLAGLALVTAAIFVLAWLVKRLGGASIMPSQRIKLDASLSLGTREKIALVCVEDKKLLLGITQGNIACLHVFDDIPATEVETQAEQCVKLPGETEQAEAGSKKWDFSQILTRAISEGIRS